MGAFPLPTDEPCRWDGSVTLDGSPATSVTVEGYVNNVQQKTYTVGSNSLYTMTLGGSTDDDVTFKVCGVTAETDTFEAYDTRMLDVSVTKQADGVACSCAVVCSSGTCTDGSCGTPAPDPAPTGGTGGGGNGGGGGGSSSGFINSTAAGTSSGTGGTTGTTNTGTPRVNPNGAPIIRDVFNAEDQGPLFSEGQAGGTTTDSTGTPLTGAAVVNFITQNPVRNGFVALLVLAGIVGVIVVARRQK